MKIRERDVLAENVLGLELALAQEARALACRCEGGRVSVVIVVRSASPGASGGCRCRWRTWSRCRRVPHADRNGIHGARAARRRVWDLGRGLSELRLLRVPLVDILRNLRCERARGGLAVGITFRLVDVGGMIFAPFAVELEEYSGSKLTP